MLFLIHFVLGVSLVGGNNAIHDGRQALDDGFLPHKEAPATPLRDRTDPMGLCKTIGNEFCGNARCEIAQITKDTFRCNCGKLEYFDATDKSCKHLLSCGVKPCAIGTCKNNDPRVIRMCDCSYTKWFNDVDANCTIRPSKHEECRKLGAKARIVDEDKGVICDCNLGMILKGNKCEANTCVNYSMSCQELCEKRWLDKDKRCCQGWNRKKCSETPDDDTYCPTGTVEKEDGKCEDACTAGLGDLVCPNGCTPTPGQPKPFTCKCKDGEELGEDGLTCRRKGRCNEEEKSRCRPDQKCFLQGTTAVCRCDEHHREENGVCTDTCATAKDCHLRLSTCRRHYNQEGCYCEPPLSKPRNPEGFCTLDSFSYILTFLTNDTAYHDADLCQYKLPDVRKAMRVLYGNDLDNVELKKCSVDAVVLQLTFKVKQDPAILKTILFCRFRQNGNCFIAPNFYIKINSVKGPVEEDLCGGVLVKMLNHPGGPQVCEKNEDNYTLKCLDDKMAHSTVTAGRVTLSLCTETKSTAVYVRAEEITDSYGTTVAPEPQEREDPCKTIGKAFCGSRPCKPFDNKESFMCDCGKDSYFDATDKQCKGRPKKAKCTSDESAECKSKNKVCVIRNSVPTCECPPDTVPVSGGCSGNCTDEDIKNECSSGFTSCAVEDHKQVCACGRFLRWDSNDRKCVLDETYWYRLSFKLHERSKRSTDSVATCEDHRLNVENSLKVLYGNELRKTKILECTDDYEVEMAFSKKQNAAVLQQIQRCEHGDSENSCFFPPALYIEKGSVSNVTEEDICTLDSDELALKFGSGLECQKEGDMQFSLKCSERYKKAMDYAVGKLQVDVCAKKTCAEYCTKPHHECDGENCVCEMDHVFEGGECVSPCLKNPCRNGGACYPNKKTTFYCRCKSGFAGPVCEQKDEELAATMRNTTIVGTVLGALIVLCLAVAFVIVRRLQNEAAAAQNESEVSQEYADDTK